MLTPEKPCALHNCPGGDNARCCNPDHLWAGNQGENMADKVRKGRHVTPTGERHGSARLTAAEVAEIRRLYEAGGVTYRDLATRYGVGQSAVGHIVTGHNWSWVAPAGN